MCEEAVDDGDLGEHSEKIKVTCRWILVGGASVGCDGLAVVVVLGIIAIALEGDKVSCSRSGSRVHAAIASPRLGEHAWGEVGVEFAMGGERRIDIFLL